MTINAYTWRTKVTDYVYNMCYKIIFNRFDKKNLIKRSFCVKKA